MTTQYRYKQIIYGGLLSVFLFFTITSMAHAATLRLLQNGEFDTGPGGKISVNLVVDTGSIYINAAEAKVSFSNDILELVSVERTGSIFNFWLKEPEYSNKEGVMTFAGGTPRGVSGNSLQILRLHFLVKGVGDADVQIEDGVVSANDGKGTNVLFNIENLCIESCGIGAQTVTTARQPVAGQEQPVEVVHTPVPGEATPEAPELRVNLYSDQTLWHNYTGDTIVLWKLPNDVTKIATALNHNPNGVPQTSTSQLSTGKDFGALDEGVWYVHVQFKNNVGWGAVAHHRIAIDTTPPTVLEVEIERDSEEDPTAEITLHGHDALSGISHADIYIDGEKIETVSSREGHLETSRLVLPSVNPGRHVIGVEMFDVAGNSIEERMEIDVLPIQTPRIVFKPEVAHLAGGEFVWGYGMAHTLVTLRLVSEEGFEVFSKTVESTGEGHWMVNLDTALPNGVYTLEVSAEDERGARSYPTTTALVVKEEIWIFTIGAHDFSLLEIVLAGALLLIFVSGFVPESRKEAILRRFFAQKEKSKEKKPTKEKRASTGR
ncbi:MAG: cohesin domain-containing protein [Candidatus Pacebacteria bacterium]|nr:cohesin domain-containing protein [Candidatus Paceibacterota bacterium]